MNGYFYVLTTIDLFVLCFMCILTNLSEALDKKQKRSISIDVQNPKVRDRHYAWVREIIRILRKYRRAGRIKLHGWDAIEVTTVGKRNNYVGYYQSVIEVKLVREIVPLSGNGLGD